MAQQEAEEEYSYNRLIDVYSEVSEEARYRDRLIHNSYYLVVIAILLTWGNAATLIYSRGLNLLDPRFASPVLLASGGSIVIVAAVIHSYNQKKRAAEILRNRIETEYLDKYDPDDLLKIHQNVVHGDKGSDLETRLRTGIDIKRYSALSLYFGLLLVAIGLAYPLILALL